MGVKERTRQLLKKSLTVQKAVMKYREMIRIFNEKKYKRYHRHPLLTEAQFKQIDQSIKDHFKGKVKYVFFDDKNVQAFERKLKIFQTYYYHHNSIVLSYYAINYFFRFKKYASTDIYIDIGVQNSPWIKWLNSTNSIWNIRAYGLDIVETATYSKKDSYFVLSDAAHTPFKNESIYAISFVSVLEVLKDEQAVIRECGRILKKGGQAILCPLYMSTDFYNLFGKDFYARGKCDDGAKKCIRLNRNMNFTRIYDVQAINERVVEAAEEAGLKCEIYIVGNTDENLYDKKDTFIYFRYILILKKI